MDQKERIIEQAMHMFVSQGIKSVRMDDIAQQLGVSKRTLYELFGDKEGLLYLAMDRYFEEETHRARRGVRSCAQRARSDVHGAGRRDGQRRSHPAACMDNLQEVLSRRCTTRLTREGTAKSRREPAGRCSEQGVGDGLFVDTISIIDLARFRCFTTRLRPSPTRTRADAARRACPSARRSCRSSAIFSAASRLTKGLLLDRRLPEAVRTCRKPFTGCNSRREGAGLNSSVPFVRIMIMTT